MAEILAHIQKLSMLIFLVSSMLAMGMTQGSAHSSVSAFSHLPARCASPQPLPVEFPPIETCERSSFTEAVALRTTQNRHEIPTQKSAGMMSTKRIFTIVMPGKIMA
jgi:hypothetical protein